MSMEEEKGMYLAAGSRLIEYPALLGGDWSAAGVVWLLLLLLAAFCPMDEHIITVS